jgi:chain length determinant protein tyrosine kinase EpsG
MGTLDDKMSGPESVVAYIENARKGEDKDESVKKELLKAGTQWTDQRLGEILVSHGKLAVNDVERVVKYQHEKGLYFGDAAVQLRLVKQNDVLQALSVQFGYSYAQNKEAFSPELIMAHSPFGEQAEIFRNIRSQLLAGGLGSEQNMLSIVSPESKEGRSYLAANLAVAFSQLGRSTLLIDADLRAPRQHIIFNFTRRIGLSTMLTGRIRIKDLEGLPDSFPSFSKLAVFGCGAVPPNPAELLGSGTLPLMLRELVKYFDYIIIDTPPAVYQGDVISIASAAGNALMVARLDQSRMAYMKNLQSTLTQAGVKVIGTVLNQF